MSDAQVVPTKFRVLHEDEALNLEDDQDQDHKIQAPHNTDQQTINGNFIFEASYPAVVFDSVCFSVDRAQQTSNFLEECLCKLKQCFSFAANSETTNRINILKSVNLNVPCGSIFGLLGPSSCGKTTLLRCLLDVLKHDSGDIRLFCKSVSPVGGTTCCPKSAAQARRSRGCGVPGPNVGYMPQDLGLYEDYSIRDILELFCKYVRLDEEKTKSRIGFMVEFLDLPDVDRKIHSLSGGQKRRVSFAIACIHMPPLIILDEPTVGVDPLLRQSIWKYLRRLASQENRTIIITTHYIEEAAQADQVALMRAGEVLIQDSPRRIMDMNNCSTLEEAFLKICNNVQKVSVVEPAQRFKLFPQPKFNWHDKLAAGPTPCESLGLYPDSKLDSLLDDKPEPRATGTGTQLNNETNRQHKLKLGDKINRLSLVPNIVREEGPLPTNVYTHELGSMDLPRSSGKWSPEKLKPVNKLTMTGNSYNIEDSKHVLHGSRKTYTTSHRIFGLLLKNVSLFLALVHKNYKRNLNSVPLVAFQFLLPIVQMISFSLCVGGRPSNIGLGLVNNDRLLVKAIGSPDNLLSFNVSRNSTNPDEGLSIDEELLSTRFLTYIDRSMINVVPYDNLETAIKDVSRLNLWAAMEIGDNFTEALLQRFDIDNFFQLDSETIRQSVIKLYPDRSNKILDMVCTRSLVDSYRAFMQETFEQFRKLPVQLKEPIYSIKPNLISNSIDGYTESIAAGLIASLTYIMAAGLTTFIMVLERSDGILERTFTSGVNPVLYLLAHALYRSFVMAVQIAVVMFLTFYILKQPLLGSAWLAYAILITLNLTGISYGLLISSLVNDQNAAALTVVSSLVVKITLSGILWPFEAIPYWLRTISYIQPLAMPIYALKSITLKGRDLTDRNVQIGFLVSFTWMILFLTIASKRFKFYQH